MRFRSTPIVGTLVLILCTTVALAQAPSGPPQPGPDVKKLGVFVGEWTAEGDLKPGMMGPGGKTALTESCEWTSGGYALLCHETNTIPGMSKVTQVTMMAYDAEAKNYVSFRVSDWGRIWTSRGTVTGDTWTWTGEHKMADHLMHYRNTLKWTSKDSYDFKNEAGPNADSMSVMMDGKQTRVTSPSANPAPK